MKKSSSIISATYSSGAVDSGLVPNRVQPMSIKLVLASLLDAQQQRDSVENKPASLLVAQGGRHLAGFPNLRVP